MKGNILMHCLPVSFDVMFATETFMADWTSERSLTSVGSHMSDDLNSKSKNVFMANWASEPLTTSHHHTFEGITRIRGCTGACCGVTVWCGTAICLEVVS